MKKILLAFLLLGLLGGCIEKPSGKEKIEVSSANLVEAEAYFNKGNAKVSLINFEGAISDYDKAIELNPEYVVAYYNRGIAKYELKNYKSAMSDFNKANELDPEVKNPMKN